MTLESFVAQYGLWALGLGAAAEGETVVILGGLMVHRGVLPLFPAIAAAACGSFLADQLFFALGRLFRDRPFVKRTQTRPAFRHALQAFERRPTLFVFAFRFLYGLRTVSPLAIGTTNLPAARFVMLNAVAALTWATVFICAGYLFGQAIETAFGRVRSAEHLLIPALAAGGIVAVLFWLARSGPKSDRTG